MISTYLFEMKVREIIKDSSLKFMQAISESIDSEQIKTMIDRQTKEYISSHEFIEKLGAYIIDTKILDLLADMLEARRIKDYRLQ